jgi:predicted alpha/beta superfamily hydrolase
LGGLFGLYAMFNEPETFSKYIIGSPSIWWANRAIMENANTFIESGAPLNATVFMGVGALEERDGDDASLATVTNMFQLESILRKAGIDGLDISRTSFRMKLIRLWLG